MKVYMDFVFSMASGANGIQQNSLSDYFNENLGLMIFIIIFAMLLLMTISVLQITFPVVYLDLLDSKNGIDFTAKDILNGIKKRVSRIFKFMLGSVFIILPIMLIVFGLNIFLCFIIIGFPLLLIMIPAMISFINLIFYYYMNSEQGFFDALSDSYDTIRHQFWPIVGITAIVIVIIQVINSIFTLVPYLFMMASMFTTIKEGNPEDAFSSISILMSIIAVISLIMGFILNNLLIISQGMIYYSHIENNESSNYLDPIDLIGTDSE